MLDDPPRRRRVWLTALLGLVLAPLLASAADFVVDDPNKVKAAFLRHFAHYVSWPEASLPARGAPWCIGVLGPDPFGGILEKALEGRTEQGRAFVIHRAALLDELPPCQIVYITYPDAPLREAALKRLRGQPVLTVGDAPGFLLEGGIVLLEVDGRVRMSINLDQARASGLEVQTKMLEVSAAVLEHGALRRVR